MLTTPLNSIYCVLIAGTYFIGMQSEVERYQRNAIIAYFIFPVMRPCHRNKCVPALPIALYMLAACSHPTDQFQIAGSYFMAIRSEHTRHGSDIWLERSTRQAITQFTNV